jgi:protease-4
MLAMVSLVLLIVVIGVISASTSGPRVLSKSVLELRFDQPIPELTNNVEREFPGGMNEVPGLHQWVALLNHAAKDKKIEGVVMYLGGGGTGLFGYASAQTLRNALLDFKKSGKFIYAYSDNYSTGGYYLASVADSLWVSPMGSIEVKGLASVQTYFRELFDKVGINPQVFYAGKYKGASEPFRLNKMSDENRLQMRGILDTLFDHYVNDIAAARGLTPDAVRQVANTYGARDAKAAVRLKFADAVGYRGDLEDVLRAKFSVKKGRSIHTVSMQEYNQAASLKPKYAGKDKIAVVYAEGGIGDGESAQNGSIIQEPYRKVFDKIRQDDKIKAIVLRINSGGGSAIASEDIHREISRCKAAGKPVVVSMGDVAASGGYYIACNADSIFAEANTITGSIGVVGFIPGVEKMLNDKFYLNFDTVKTSPYATMLSGPYDITADEGKLIQEMVDTTYSLFLSRVAAGRGRTREAIHEIAQGRVWMGRKALEIGLVDRIGSLDDAIQSAARMAKTTSFKLVDYPKPQDPIQELVGQFLGQNDTKIASALLKWVPTSWLPAIESMHQMVMGGGMQMRLMWYVPFE